MYVSSLSEWKWLRWRMFKHLLLIFALSLAVSPTHSSPTQTEWNVKCQKLESARGKPAAFRERVSLGLRKTVGTPVVNIVSMAIQPRDAQHPKWFPCNTAGEEAVAKDVELMSAGAIVRNIFVKGLEDITSLNKVTGKPISTTQMDVLVSLTLADVLVLWVPKLSVNATRALITLRWWAALLRLYRHRRAPLPRMLVFSGDHENVTTFQETYRHNQARLTSKWGERSNDWLGPDSFLDTFPHGLFRNVRAASMCGDRTLPSHLFVDLLDDLMRDSNPHFKEGHQAAVREAEAGAGELLDWWSSTLAMTNRNAPRTLYQNLLTVERMVGEMVPTWYSSYMLQIAMGYTPPATVQELDSCHYEFANKTILYYTKMIGYRWTNRLAPLGRLLSEMHHDSTVPTYHAVVHDYRMKAIGPALEMASQSDRLVAVTERENYTETARASIEQQVQHFMQLDMFLGRYQDVPHDNLEEKFTYNKFQMAKDTAVKRLEVLMIMSVHVSALRTNGTRKMTKKLGPWGTIDRWIDRKTNATQDHLTHLCDSMDCPDFDVFVRGWRGDVEALRSWWKVQHEMRLQEAVAKARAGAINTFHDELDSTACRPASNSDWLAIRATVLAAYHASLEKKILGEQLVVDTRISLAAWVEERLSSVDPTGRKRSNKYGEPEDADPSIESSIFGNFWDMENLPLDCTQGISNGPFALWVYCIECPQYQQNTFPGRPLPPRWPDVRFKRAMRRAARKAASAARSPAVLVIGVIVSTGLIFLQKKEQPIAASQTETYSSPDQSIGRVRRESFSGGSGGAKKRSKTSAKSAKLRLLASNPPTLPSRTTPKNTPVQKAMSAGALADKSTMSGISIKNTGESRKSEGEGVFFASEKRKGDLSTIQSVDEGQQGAAVDRERSADRGEIALSESDPGELESGDGFESISATDLENQSEMSVGQQDSSSLVDLQSGFNPTTLAESISTLKPSQSIGHSHVLTPPTSPPNQPAFLEASHDTGDQSHREDSHGAVTLDESSNGLPTPVSPPTLLPPMDETSHDDPHHPPTPIIPVVVSPVAPHNFPNPPAKVEPEPKSEEPKFRKYPSPLSHNRSPSAPSMSGNFFVNDIFGGNQSSPDNRSSFSRDPVAVLGDGGMLRMPPSPMFPLEHSLFAVSPKEALVSAAVRTPSGINQPKAPGSNLIRRSSDQSWDPNTSSSPFFYPSPLATPHHNNPIVSQQQQPHPVHSLAEDHDVEELPDGSSDEFDWVMSPNPIAQRRSQTLQKCEGPGCDATGYDMMLCPACDRVSYCSGDCQFRHWGASHQSECSTAHEPISFFQHHQHHMGGP